MGGTTAAEHARTSNAAGIKGVRASEVRLEEPPAKIRRVGSVSAAGGQDLLPAEGQQMSADGGLDQLPAEGQQISAAVQGPGPKKKMPKGSSLFNEKQRVDDKHLLIKKFSGHGPGLLVQAPTAVACKVTSRVGEAAPAPPPIVKDSKQEQIREKRARKAQRLSEVGQNVQPQTAFATQRTVARNAAEEKKEQDLAGEQLCPRCPKLFLCNKPAFNKHVEQCGRVPKPPQTLAAMTIDVVGKAVAVAEERADASAKAGRGRVLTFRFDSLQQLESELNPEFVGGCWVVRGMSTLRLQLAAHLYTGCKLVQIGSVTPQGSSAQHALSQGSFPSDIQFELPPPPLVPRGWAAEKRTWKVNPTTEQQGFLFERWDKERKVSAAVLKGDMDKHFAGRQELHMCRADIQVMLQRFYSRLTKKTRPANEPQGAQETQDTEQEEADEDEADEME